jgi:hypothetical protein
MVADTLYADCDPSWMRVERARSDLYWLEGKGLVVRRGIEARSGCGPPPQPLGSGPDARRDRSSARHVGLQRREGDGPCPQSGLGYALSAETVGLMRSLTLLTILYLALILVLLGWAAKEAGATPVHHHPPVCHHAHHRVRCPHKARRAPATPQPGVPPTQTPAVAIAAPQAPVEAETPFVSESEVVTPVTEAELASWAQPEEPAEAEESEPAEEG